MNIIFKNIGVEIRKSSPKRDKKKFSLYYKSYAPCTK